MPFSKVINKICEHEFNRGVVAGFWTGIAFTLILYYVVTKIQKKLRYHD
jgi:hypothetical protein